MTIPSVPAAPPSPSWDPLAGPYTTRECRQDDHERCPRGLIYYPFGVSGLAVDVRCACDHEGCPCGTARSAGAAP